MADIDQPLENCAGCGNATSWSEFVECLCLGCMLKFKRCVRCYPTFSSCSPVCKDKHRERLKLFFGANAPPIKGGDEPWKSR